MKMFVLVTKVLPMLLALFHFINTVLSYFYIDLIVLNYIAGISLLTIAYLYLASYVIKLCAYYRMFLHYCVIIDIANIIDLYIGIPIDDYNWFLLFVIFTIIFMFVTLYIKFHKCD